MSKSLKNFITIDVSNESAKHACHALHIIQEALQTYSARQLRLAFMLQIWNAKLDFKKDLIVDTKAKEETFDVSFKSDS